MFSTRYGSNEDDQCRETETISVVTGCRSRTSWAIPVIESAKYKKDKSGKRKRVANLSDIEKRREWKAWQKRQQQSWKAKAEVIGVPPTLPSDGVAEAAPASQYVQWPAKVFTPPIMLQWDELQITSKQFFQINFFIHNWRNQINTVIVEGGYMSGIPAKKHVQIKIHWL